MITSARNPRWPGDIALIDDHDAYGLPIPSLIRTTKIAVFEMSSAERIGRVSDAIMASVRDQLSAHLALGPTITR